MRDDIVDRVPLPALEDCVQERVRTNLLALRWAFQSLLLIAKNEGVQDIVCQMLSAHFDKALGESVNALNEEVQKLRATIPEGNLAYVLLKGYQDGKFRLLYGTKKIEKLWKRDGVLIHNDLCLRTVALETYVRRQNGYQHWSLNKIVKELSDYGALCIQEEATKQVKISKDSNIPRVYRIKLQALEDKSIRY